MAQCNGRKLENGHSEDTNGTVTKDSQITRKTVECSEIFKNSFSITDNNLKQFACVYSKRLRNLLEILTKKAQNKWKNIEILQLADLQNFNGEQCIIIGTIYKHQQWKPSILRELCEKDQLILPESRTDYCSESDQLFLEDETARIKLLGDKIEIDELVTGVVVAVLGHENENSNFEVEEYCFPGCSPQIKSTTSTTGKLVLLSGLNMSNESNKLATILLSEWLCGLTGNLETQETDASIVNVIIAGNSIKTNPGLLSNNDLINFTAKNSNYHEITGGLEKLDSFISKIAETCCITLMPGEEDVASLMMPQRDLHPCLLPKSCRYETFTRATNPWVSNIGKRIVAGSSGQPIKDIVKCCGKSKSYLDMLEKTLIWRHYSPTCPDTLPSYSCDQNTDPMIMRECPDIYFAGNVDKFETKLWKGNRNETVRLICIPSFSKTQTAVIVDMETLDVQPVSFGAD